MIKPINTKSLKDLFVGQLEEHILSGYFRSGEKLPAERDLAVKMGVSRPVVHEGLVELAAKGLVTMRPRHGCIVNDYRKEGSLGLLKTMFRLGDEKIGRELLSGLLEMRLLFEVENARLSALNRTGEQLKALFTIVENEEKTPVQDSASITALDFEFHHLTAVASGNVVYPLMLNSMKSTYIKLAQIFFSNPGVIPDVVTFHKNMADAVAQQDPDSAMQVMKKMILHGERHLRCRLAEFVSS
jgi:fatty acid metabolism transcriptional regulator FadR